MSYVADLFARYPEVGTVLVYLLAVGLHVAVGAALHITRYNDFDWHKLGLFVEQDFATRRGVAIGTTFVLSLVTTVVPGNDFRAAFIPATAALVAACAAGTLPVLRDTARELVEMLSGTPAPPSTTSPPIPLQVDVPVLAVPSTPSATAHVERTS